jgi:hypothetical protein
MVIPNIQCEFWKQNVHRGYENTFLNDVYSLVMVGQAMFAIKAHRPSRWIARNDDVCRGDNNPISLRIQSILPMKNSPPDPFVA